uniref:Uncharacterized protein n=1 Tax=Heliothis virescens TaxID=7102 RepID=A0A2A4K700_HELVI
MVLYQTLETFFSSLVNFQMLIEFIKTFGAPMESSVMIVLIYIWMLKAVFIQVALGLSFDRFYQSVEDVQDSCVLVTTSSCPTGKVCFYL